MQDRNGNPFLDDTLPNRSGPTESVDTQRWYRTESCWNCEQTDRLTLPGRMRLFRTRLKKQ